VSQSGDEGGRAIIRLPRASVLGVLAAAIAAATVVSACGSGSSGGSSGGQLAGSVSIGAAEDPAAFGYDPAAFYGGSEVTFFQALYSSLFATTSAAAVEPELATGYTFNAAKTVLTLTLRQGVKFTDGTILTAALVKENLDRRSDPTLGAYGMFARGGSAEILDVAATGPSTVVITFAKPEASAPSLLADDAGRIVGGKAIANPKMLQTTPDGSGPYTLSSSGTVKGNTYTLAKNKTAWDASSFPYPTIVFKVLQNSQTMANALVSGQVQVAQLDPTTVSFVKPKDSVVGFSGTEYGFSLFDKLGKISKPHGFSFTMLVSGTQYDLDLQAVQKQWEAVGVTMKIKPVTSFAAVLQSQTTTALGYFQFTLGRDPLNWVNSFLLSGTTNAQHAVDPKIASAVQAAESGSGNSDVAALKILDDAIVNEGWSISLYGQPVYYGYNSSQVAAPESSSGTIYPLLSGVVPAAR
jgi:ABC-type transport system substrate-binding protein